MDGHFEIVEVSPRDGLQNEKKILTTTQKIELISRAIDAGLTRIEVTSFVNPKRVPQMFDSDELVQNLPKKNGRDIKYIGLVLNEHGFTRALKSDLDIANFAIVASDTFSIKNQGATTSENLKTLKKIFHESNEKIQIAVTIAASFGCPFDGEISSNHLLSIVEQIAKIGLNEICLADTIGVATPKDIKTKLKAIKGCFPEMAIKLHLHNTRNTGIANAWTGIEQGITGLESSFGGSGGCPFAPKATGNIPTEDLLYMLNRSGVTTGISLQKSIETANWLEQQLEKKLPGLLKETDIFPPNEFGES
tara:strand:+ start:1767 stop:2684 length:918 start_codon:yes stop_codon:yes gene_type:complete